MPVTSQASSVEETDSRQDPLSNGLVVVARGRQDRPNLPSADVCPFCPGGLEAPEDYEVRWFKNRWPPLPDERCEVVLFSPDHSQSVGVSRDPRRCGCSSENLAAAEL